MALNVPYPNVPTDGQSLEASTLLANLNAIYQAIQQFDASQVSPGTLAAAAFIASINPNTILNDTISPFVQSGCIWSAASGLNGTMSSGIIYVGPSGSILRVSVPAVGSFTFTASKDTYVDIDYNGNVTYQAVSNGAAAPALTAHAVRVAKVVTNASTISSVTQFGSDGIGNIIYPTGPTSAKLIQNPYKFSVYRSAALTSSATPTRVPFDTKTVDTGNNVDIATNIGRFTAPIAGFYQFYAQVVVTQSGNLYALTSIAKNGAVVATNEQSSTNTPLNTVVSDLISLAANDYVEVYLQTQNAVAVAAGSASTYFYGFLVSAT